MSVAAFDRFVAEEQLKISLPEQANPQWQKQDFLQALDDLYDQLASFLDTYVSNRQVDIDFSDVTINEEFIRPYQARAMLIRIGTKTIMLEPVGMIQVAARGRVDMTGPFGRAQLLRLDSRAKSMTDLVWGPGYTGQVPVADSQADSQWVWGLVTRPPERRIDELNRENFLRAVLEISNG